MNSSTRLTGTFGYQLFHLFLSLSLVSGSITTFTGQSDVVVVIGSFVSTIYDVFDGYIVKLEPIATVQAWHNEAFH